MKRVKRERRKERREKERRKGGREREREGRKVYLKLLHSPEIRQLFDNSFGQDKRNEVEKKNQKKGDLRALSCKTHFSFLNKSLNSVVSKVPRRTGSWLLRMFLTGLWRAKGKTPYLL